MGTNHLKHAYRFNQLNFQHVSAQNPDMVSQDQSNDDEEEEKHEGENEAEMDAPPPQQTASNEVP